MPYVGIFCSTMYFSRSARWAQSPGACGAPVAHRVPGSPSRAREATSGCRDAVIASVARRTRM